MRLKSFSLLKAALDAPAQLVETFAKAERLFSVGAIWNDWLGTVLIQFLAQLGAVVRFVTEQASRRASLCRSDARPADNRARRLRLTGWRSGAL